ncbi:MAG: PaaI family thioesterase [Xanthobacteraceae bacterium]|nr:PaaI family thioesterase [Xanthobacteraceae bacterium]
MPAKPSFTYGLPNPAEVAVMNGRQMLQAMIEGKVPAPPIAQTLSFWLAEVGDGTCVFEGETGPHLLNPLGGVHGGWALTLIDSAAGCAGHTLLPALTGYASVETKVNFTRPIKHDTGRVRAEGRVVTRGRQIMSAEARILDADGRILAHGTSTLMVFGDGKTEDRTPAAKSAAHRS